MSIQDIIKKSFIEGFQNTDMSIKTMVLLLALSALVGIYIFFIYRIMTLNSFYSKGFNVSLILISIITTAIIITIQSSVVVSLGMVGALSIVRFRTAIKEPLDLIFLFWSISVGIICGAGMPFLSMALSLVLTVIIIIFYRMPEVRKSMILVVNANTNNCAEEIYSIVEKYDKGYKIKSRNVSKENADFLFEIRIKDYEKLLQELNEFDDIKTASIISHKGDAVY